MYFGGYAKFLPNLSPAQTLAVQTIDVLTFSLVPGAVSLVLLATLECAIGLGLFSSRFMSQTLLLLFPGEVFNDFPYAPTLEGQYIIKNIVLVSVGLFIGATVRGGLTADPEDIGAVRGTERRE